MTDIKIEERRRNENTKRSFERRRTGTEDLRLTDYLDEIGLKAVKTEMERTGFPGRTMEVKKWLKNRHAHNSWFGWPGLFVSGAGAGAVITIVIILLDPFA